MSRTVSGIYLIPDGANDHTGHRDDNVLERQLNATCN